jgi:hypothetical protein
VTARIEGTDTVSVDLAALSQQFQEQINGWRTAAVPPDSTSSDTVGTDTTTTSAEMARDSVSE